MKTLGFLLTLGILTGCATTPKPGPYGQDLCLSKQLEVYPGYELGPGRYPLKRSTNASDIYEPAHIAQGFAVRYIKATWLTPTSAELCVVDYDNAHCAKTLNLQRCQ